MAVCPNCGNQTSEGAVFCDQCGTRLAQPEVPAPEVHRHRLEAVSSAPPAVRATYLARRSATIAGRRWRRRCRRRGGAGAGAVAREAELEVTPAGSRKRRLLWKRQPRWPRRKADLSGVWCRGVVR